MKLEDQIQTEIRLVTANNNGMLFRNNTGVAVNPAGQHIRYGLANESKAQNKRVKSSDLIGIQQVIIGPEHIGRTLGVFVAIEVKREGWKYTGTDREQAQLKFIEKIREFGGLAGFAASVQDYHNIINEGT